MGGVYAVDVTKLGFLILGLELDYFYFFFFLPSRIGFY